MVTVGKTKFAPTRRRINNNRCRLLIIIVTVVVFVVAGVYGIFTTLLQMSSDYRDRTQLMNQLSQLKNGNDWMDYISTTNYSSFKTKTTTNADESSSTLTSKKSVAYVICLHSAPTNPDGSLAAKTEDGRSLKMANSLAVLVASVRRIAKKSSYQTHLVAIVRRSILSEFEIPLKDDYGFDRVVAVDRLVNFDDMAEPARTQAQTNKIYFANTLVSEENDKLYMYNLTRYDRVVLLDTDVILVNQPIDELLDSPAETLGTLDYYALEPGTSHPEGGMKLSVLPPINAGFIVARPSQRVLEGVKEVLRRGKFTTGQTKDGYIAGWDGLGIGYYFGGISIQGVLPAYYFQNLTASVMTTNRTRYQAVQEYLHPALSSSNTNNNYFQEVDQCVYNVLAHPNCQGRDAGVQGTPNCRNVDCSPHVNPTMDSVKDNWKVLHFTGSCLNFRPWILCQGGALRKNAAIPELCRAFIYHWMDIAEYFLNTNENNYKSVAPNLPTCLEKLQQRFK